MEKYLKFDQVQLCDIMVVIVFKLLLLIYNYYIFWKSI